MLHLPAPAVLNGDALAAELADALGEPVTVTLVGDQVRVLVNDEAEVDEAAARAVVAAHAPAPAEAVAPLTDAEVSALRVLLASNTL